MERMALPNELVLRYFPHGSAARENLVMSVVELDKWAASVLTEGLDVAVKGIAGSQTCSTALDLIELVAETLTRHAHGQTRDLLSKSIQETLFCSTVTKYGLTKLEFEERLKQFLDRRGASGFVRLFLSLHVFNVVWFQTSEWFRATAESNEAFVHEMDCLERTARRIVHTTVKSKPYPLTLSSAEQLIAEISRRLQELRY